MWFTPISIFPLKGEEVWCSDKQVVQRSLCTRSIPKCARLGKPALVGYPVLNLQ